MTMSAASLSEYSSLYVPIQLPNAADLNRPWTRYLSYKVVIVYKHNTLSYAVLKPYLFCTTATSPLPY